ncbi:phage integrase N-terminal SAM-like domain-containing protein [Vibrio rotiferianus]|nr:phage integrase N-terminal SAM-like domain-containing protein [Vibrio rotiferianus]
MNNVTYLNRWNTSMCLRMEHEKNYLCDFNRLLHRGFPSTQYIQQGKPVESANRDGFILQIKERFDEKISEGASQITLYHLFNHTSQYLKWCDAKDAEAFTQQSLEAYMAALFHQVRLGTLKASSYSQKLSRMNVLFRDFLDLPSNWFLSIPSTGWGDAEPFEAYTQSDLKQLLPFLRQLFNQTSRQFLENPQKHIDAWKTTSTMTFRWHGQDYKLCSAISKMMCAATYLMSYYTYSNTGVLFELKRPTNASISVGEQWYQMPAFKRRSFKIIHVEMGEHGYLEVPKYSMGFFDKLLEVSKILDNSSNALLLQTIAHNKLQPVKQATLQAFNKNWLEKHFSFTDQTARKLRPVVSRFRETGSQITTAYQGELANDITLGNTPQTRKRHYTTGNKHNNNAMMQDVTTIRQEQAQSKQGVTAARSALGIEVLTIEEELKTTFPELSRTPNGGSCANPFGERSEAYNRKAQQRKLLKNGEKLACADLLKCFGCPEQVIVQSVSDIWCLLSFKECIEESLYLHLNAHHYRQNFESIVVFITEKIFPKINKSILKQAEALIDEEGLHPLWEDSDAVLSMIPTQRVDSAAKELIND